MFVCSHLSYFDGEAEGLEDEIIEENFYTSNEDDIGRLVVTEQDTLTAGEPQEDNEEAEIDPLTLNLAEQPDQLIEPRVKRRNNLGLDGLHMEEDPEEECSKEHSQQDAVPSPPADPESVDKQMEDGDEKLLSALGFQDDQEEDAAGFKIEKDKLILGELHELDKMDAAKNNKNGEDVDMIDNDDDWGRPSPEGITDELLEEEAQRQTVVTPEDDAIMLPTSSHQE